MKQGTNSACLIVVMILLSSALCHAHLLAQSGSSPSDFPTSDSQARHEICPSRPPHPAYPGYSLGHIGAQTPPADHFKIAGTDDSALLDPSPFRTGREGTLLQVQADHLWTASGDTDAVPSPNGSTPAPSKEITHKSGWVAGLLGGVLGYGSGQFYTRRWISGSAFLVVDGLLTAALVACLTASSDDRPESKNDPINQDISQMVTKGFNWVGAGLAITGLLISHTAQAIWGPLAVGHDNRIRSESH